MEKGQVVGHYTRADFEPLRLGAWLVGHNDKPFPSVALR